VRADLQLLHRVDTEFTNEELRGLFARFEQPVLFVPGEFLRLNSLLREVLVRAIARDASRAGYIRTRAALEGLWKETHSHSSLRVGAASAYLVRPSHERNTASTKRSKSSA
jgi:hypothetical protein